MVAVGDGERAPLIYLADEPAEVTLEPGEAADLTVAVGSHARAELALEAHLISPWGTWDWMGPAAVGAVLPARGAVDLGFRLAPRPGWTPASGGRWSGSAARANCSTRRRCG
ncbi:putative alpha-mannosidase [Mycobacterium avium subsp. avium 2285 (R)]|nr:putative alpha-mannosidase [Mycobacterium avium subsp. avium 2285 (R)]